MAVAIGLVMMFRSVQAAEAGEARPDGDLLPLGDAAAVWRFGGEQGTASRFPLVAHGNVQTGVKLSGADLAASLLRGGNGRVAAFNGGYFSLAVDSELKLNKTQCTIAIRLRDPSGRWQFPILGSYGNDDLVSLVLRAVDGKTRPLWDRRYTGSKLPTVESWLYTPGGPRSVPGSTAQIEAVWGAQNPDMARIGRIRKLQSANTWPNPLQQDVFHAVMRINFPVSLIGPKDWHDLVVRLTGPKFQLFVDGVLVDEEFPIGVTRKRTSPFLIGAAYTDGELKTGFDGQIDYVAAWNRALTDDEVTALCGGVTTIRQHELAILGDEAASMQYFRPRGHNRKAGDCIPYWDEQTGTFRLFYLILRRNMHSKWDGGHGGLEILQASTKDLKMWTHHPVTIPISEQWQAWNGTGAVAFHNGQYNWFYPCPDYAGEHGGIQRAVSKDCVTFTKVGPYPFMSGGDLEIFQDASGLFNLVKAGPTQIANTPSIKTKTLVAWVRLTDLNQRGGSVLTIENSDGVQFDGIVFGERLPRRWMPGSNNLVRTPRDQGDWVAEMAAPNDIVQLAAVYTGETGMLYRDGELYASYPIARLASFPSGSSLLIGKRHTRAAPINAFFHGRVLDARLYNAALSPRQLVQLKPDTVAGPKPLAWYDFERGSLHDRMGTFPTGMLVGKAHVENGELVVGDNSYFKVSGILNTQVRLTSPDLETWTEQPNAFIASDRRLNICPNVFRFGDWCYYICGTGAWKSHTGFGSWVENVPPKPDNLSVPKTASFGEDRRIYAGFLGDGGWGGNTVLRELVQDDDGNLGTRFVKELIPATGDILPLHPEASEGCVVNGNSIILKGDAGHASAMIPKVVGDYRIQAEIVPSLGLETVGIEVKVSSRTGKGLPIIVDVPHRLVSCGDRRINEVSGLEHPFKIDIIVRYDIVDVEIAEFRSCTTRFWQPAGTEIRLSAEGADATIRNLSIRPVVEPYVPYPALSVHPADACFRNADHRTK